MAEESPYPRFFTLQEASRLLPTIEPLVDEMRKAFTAIRKEIEAAAREAGVATNDPRLSEKVEERGIAPPLVARVNELIARVHAEGCLVNGPEAGLVDFPALFGSEIVFLCWQHGEDAIGHWHRIPDGFAGRRPLLDDSAPSDSFDTAH
jgi:hypothetical protein